MLAVRVQLAVYVVSLWHSDVELLQVTEVYQEELVCPAQTGRLVPRVQREDQGCRDLTVREEMPEIQVPVDRAAGLVYLAWKANVEKLGILEDLEQKAEKYVVNI